MECHTHYVSVWLKHRLNVFVFPFVEPVCVPSKQQIQLDFDTTLQQMKMNLFCKRKTEIHTVMRMSTICMLFSWHFHSFLQFQYNWKWVQKSFSVAKKELITTEATKRKIIIENTLDSIATSNNHIINLDKKHFSGYFESQKHKEAP